MIARGATSITLRAITSKAALERTSQLKLTAIHLKGILLLLGNLLALRCQGCLGGGILSSFLPALAPLRNRGLVLGTCRFRDLVGNTGVVLGDKIVAVGNANLFTAAHRGRSPGVAA